MRVTSTATVEVLYINLARRPDRRVRLEASLNSTDFSAHRIDAVDAKSPAFKPATHLVAAAEEACWMSHQRAFRHQTDSEFEYALILEDDAHFDQRKFSSELLLEICEYMSNNGIKVFQLGYLGFQYRWWEISRIVENTRALLQGKHRVFKSQSGAKVHIVQDSFRSGAHGYLLHIDGARQLLKLNYPVVFPADDFLSLVANRKIPDLLFARSRSSLIGQWSRKTLGSDGLDSDIENRK